MCCDNFCDNCATFSLSGSRRDRSLGVATPARLERATYALGGHCSIQLSYGAKLLRIADGVLGPKALEVGWLGYSLQMSSELGAVHSGFK